MSDPPVDLWTTRDLPVLVAVTRHVDAGRAGVKSDVIAAETGLPEPEVYLAAKALERHNHVSIRSNWAGRWATFHDVSSEAYYMAGLYPDPGDRVEQLLDALTKAAHTAADADTRSRLRRIASEVGKIPTSVTSGVLTAWLTAQVVG